MTAISLSELIGSPVTDAGGALAGRVREIALSPQDHSARVSTMVVRTHEGDRLLDVASISEITSSGVRATTKRDDWKPMPGVEGLLLLERDLLDQQIIDVNGKKVVRVNDIDFVLDAQNGSPSLRVRGVEVGPRGAVRRLLRGL